MYCFVFWKLSNLGRYRIPLFIYAVVMQSAFLISYVWFTHYFRTAESVDRDYFDVFANGIFVFYFLLMIPLVAALCIHTYKGIQKLAIGKASKIIMMILFVFLCLVISVFGVYAHFFFYYGFAP